MVEITGGKATVLGERVMRGDRVWKRERTAKCDNTGHLVGHAAVSVF
jgi:hypothetical protein